MKAPGKYYGGFSGVNYPYGTNICNFWNIQTSGLSNAVGDGFNSGISPLTTPQFAERSNLQCFDFYSPWMIYNGYPTIIELTIPTLSQWSVIILISMICLISMFFSIFSINLIYL